MGRWLRDDGYKRLARERGYRSRAAFKLLQLDKKYGLIREGDVVVDLGAAPGGWLQVARQRVGEGGFVLGVDLMPIRELPFENVKTIVADITHPDTADLILQNLPRKADVLLSDASPQISGIWSVDHLRSVELCRSALGLCRRVLREGGNAVLKLFQGGEQAPLWREFSRQFEFSKISKPSASRSGSAEIYLVGKRFRSGQS
ncbi:MAG: RlmE family RNA methyltransferase [Candidatus Hadarchaeales archaeon]